MKTMQLLGVACSVLALGLVGCEKKESPKPTPPKSTTDALKDAAKDAGATVDKAAKEAKDKVVATAQDLYDSAKKELDALAARVSGSTSPEKPLWEKAVDGVKTEFAAVEKKLSDLKADNSDWAKINEELSTLMTKAKESLQSLASKVK
jgi:hypothetical protein